MSDTRTDYPDRLPYGYWFDPDTGMEYLFDRGYCAIASRPVAEPWCVSMILPRTHVRCPVERWFYPDDSLSPSRRKDALARCETILSRFICGIDVRPFLHTKNGDKTVPETGGKYLAMKPRSPSELIQRLGDENVLNPRFKRPAHDDILD